MVRFVKIRIWILSVSGLDDEIIVDETGKFGYIVHSNVLIFMGIMLIHSILRDRVFEHPQTYAVIAVLNFVWRFFSFASAVGATGGEACPISINPFEGL